ncbi:hypothetical protein BKA65DRAFT_485063 [Rhexocercosporidium sp. MPI-PUGE-AT-0058]|nr:hypothetical protein BKA65DRAFT_485063 [Rhexocercosporidium sp. MPI-PUGE-AT-0058]
MSGFEVVGVVLGGFPLLVGAAKKWMEGVEALVEWKRFRPRFISFLGAIDVENTIFRNTLLNVMITATASMSMDVDYLEWKNPDLGKALENPDVAKALVVHLGDSYYGFIRTITTIQCAIDGLHELLTAEDGNADWADPKISQWQYRLKSFQLSFSSEGEELKGILEEENKRLQRLLASNAQVTFVRASASSAKSAWARLFRIVRDQSLSLHAALQKVWTCDCRAPHRFHLQLDTTYTETKTPSFGMVVELEVETEPLQGRRQRVLLQNSLVIGTQQEKRKERPGNFPTSSSASSLAGDVSKLTCDLKSAQLLSSQKPKKLQKKARFAVTHSPGLLPPPSQSRTPSPSPSLSPSLASLDQGTEGKRLHNLCTELRSTSVVGFCAGFMVGNEGQRHYLTIETRQELNILLPRTVSLEDLLLKNGGLEFRREKRYQVASILASCLLQLCTTPWIPKLEKKNIIFPRNGLDVATDRPCVLQGFKKAAPKLPNTSTIAQQGGASQNTGTDSEKVKGALVSLGILLLELCYGETIEQQPFHQRYLRRDGRVGRLTDLKAALEWVQDVTNEEPNLENVIMCCLNYSFPQKADWNDVEFRQAVYDNVIKPVEDLARAWTL